AVAEQQVAGATNPQSLFDRVVEQRRVGLYLGQALRIGEQELERVCHQRRDGVGPGRDQVDQVRDDAVGRQRLLIVVVLGVHEHRDQIVVRLNAPLLDQRVQVLA